MAFCTHMQHIKITIYFNTTVILTSATNTVRVMYMYYPPSRHSAITSLLELRTCIVFTVNLQILLIEQSLAASFSNSGWLSPLPSIRNECIPVSMCTISSFLISYFPIPYTPYCCTDLLNWKLVLWNSCPFEHCVSCELEFLNLLSS